jgi:YHS domain-containing protein
MLFTSRQRSFLMGLFLLLTSPSLAAESLNEYCPVIPDRKASARHTTVYQGKEIRFCCSNCVKEFEENPQVYATQVPQLQRLTWNEKVRIFLDANTRFVIIGLLVGLLIALRVVRWRRLDQTTAKPTLFERIVIRPTPVAFPLAGAVVLLSGMTWKFQHDLLLHQLEDQIHFATFYDFGFPPVPSKPPIENRVQTTFYRGNDERSAALGSGGNYRTANFHLSLASTNCDKLKYGDNVGGQELHIHFVIDRPPFTPDFMYGERLMDKMFLTQQCDRFLGSCGPIADQVNLTMTRPMQQWEARFPIYKPRSEPGSKTARIRGIIYVCEECYYQDCWWSTAKNARSGSRFHYAIPYDVTLNDGKLAADSNIWMGHLYRTRKFPAWKIPVDQWFSWNAETIPELTQPNTAADPELLGISDYEE